MKESIPYSRWSFVRSHCAVLLLMAGHLPLVIVYLTGLWQQTHYQFFPFAIGSFVWLFASRRSPGPERWTLVCKALIAFDVVCLAFGYLDPNLSPWAGAAGLVAVATAWCMACRDTGYARSLGYLAILPLLALRLPLLSDIAVIHWLQRITTSISSRAMNQLGLLHFREGNVIEFPGRTFLIEEACSGVQSLFTILFLAALVFCLKRRSLVHGIVLLSTSLIFAGILNVVRVVSIAAAWSTQSIDLSVGWSHDVLGYLCLAGAALMLLSTDAFLGFLLDPVPDLEAHGPASSFRNPLVAAWNMLMAVIPSDRARMMMNSESEVSGKNKITTTTDSDDDSELDDEERQLPSGSELLRPYNLYVFAIGFVENWFFSRRLGGLAAGAPSILITVCGILLVWWLRHASDEPIVEAYETAFNAAAQDSDVVAQETYLRALNSLRPYNPHYRFRLGLFLVEHGKQDGVEQIIALASEPNLGSTEARKWLVMQAISENPPFEMNAEEIEHHLQAVLSHVPNDAEAHALLAQQFVARREWNLAEHHLTEAARSKPELNLELAKLKTMLKRNQEDISDELDSAIIALSEQLGRNRLNADARISLADALLLAGRDAESRDTLVTGLNQKDDPKLRTALCDFDVRQIGRRLRESSLNRDVCVPVAVNALNIDPSNRAAVQMLTTLQALGSEIPPDSLQAPLTHWQSTLNERPTDSAARLILCQLLVLTGKKAEAAETIRPVLDERPDLRLPFARLLLHSEKPDEGRLLLETIISESQNKLTKTPDDIAAATVLAESLLALKRPEDARAFLMTLARDPAASPAPSDPALAALFGRASLDYYDQLTGKADHSDEAEKAVSDPIDTGADTTKLLTLLNDAFHCESTSNLSIQRLARLSLSSHPAAAMADEMVRRLRLDGPQGIQALNMLGMHALLMQKYDIAQKHLEQANALSHGRNPMVLNNLATAIVRGGSGQPERALDLVNSALAKLKNHPDALATRGEIHIAMLQWNEAIADLKAALSAGRNTAEVHRLLAKAYTGLADPQMADEHQRKAVELESTQASQ